MILIVYYKDKTLNYMENIKKFIVIFLFTFIYDFSWLMTVGDVIILILPQSFYYGKHSIDFETEKSLKRLVFYFSVCTILTKFGLIFSLFSQYQKAQEVDKIMKESGVFSNE